MNGKLIFKDKTEFFGSSFGFDSSAAGEIVFTTGMMGYPESLTDPSYKGQILVMTYPLVGNYGVCDKKYWESGKIQVSGLIVSDYIDTPSHFGSQMTLAEWLKKEKIPALVIKDTRKITQKIRDEGNSLVKMVLNQDIDFVDPNKINLVAEVSTSKIIEEGKGKKKILLIDCGVKENIKRELLKRNLSLTIVPWNFDIFKNKMEFDGMVISSGPGDPKMAEKTVDTVKKAMGLKKPILGICLGNQILALAAGGDTYKLKLGHRGQNQPCKLVGGQRCFMTTQNHGFAIGKIPKGFKPWFVNANDETNEGIIHEKLPFMSVQFHPEASPGTRDTEWLFDFFVKNL
ncbi:MAG: glutamine-hydrolyzing carbamoyl-phosphate synthase small subunit [Candidatus Shapirobacteria bacterium]|nr:glutamine-hydrolyzing carbamoyl-phosphate synthase small subunit [Candidatus Shapirobacteria bacterium]